MKPDRDVISPRQTGLFLASIMVGKGLLFLPRSIIDGVNSAAWWVELASGVFLLFGVYIIALLTERFAGESFPVYAPGLVGGPVARLVTGVYSLFFLGVATLTLRGFADVVSLSILPVTPVNVTLIILILLVSYPVFHGMETVVRLDTALFPFFALGLLFVFLISFQQHPDFGRLRPFFDINWSGLRVGMESTVYAFVGIETYLFLSGFTRTPKAAKQALFWAAGGVACLYALGILAVLVTFGSEPVRYMVWPTLDLAKSVGVPGTVIEHMELAVVVIWMTAAFTTGNGYLYAARVTAASALNLQDTQGKYLVFLFVPIIYLTGISLTRVRDVFTAINLLNHWGPVIVFGIPIFFLLLSLLRRAGEKRVSR